MLHIRFTDTAEAIQFEATDFHVRIPTYKEEFRQTEAIFDNIISAEQRRAAGFARNAAKMRYVWANGVPSGIRNAPLQL